MNKNVLRLAEKLIKNESKKYCTKEMKKMINKTKITGLITFSL